MDEEGNRTGYYRDDSREQSVQEMLQEERAATTRTIDEEFARNIVRQGRKFKAGALGGSKSGASWCPTDESCLSHDML